MFNFSSGRLMTLLLSLPGILIAISFHEIAHGYAAESMGDYTAKSMGRLSLNPLAHLSLLGTLSMLFFGFGWAKPVPVNPNNFKDRKKGIILVSLAGCVTNLILSFLALVVIYLVRGFANEVLYQILYYIYLYNLVFAVFNLIPIPPLDGSQILAVFLPYNARIKYEQFSRYGTIVLLILVVSGLFGFIITPIVNFIGGIYNGILSFIFSLF